MNAKRKTHECILSMLLAVCLLFSSQFFKVEHAYAMQTSKLTDMMQTLVIQSVTTSINSYAFSDEQEIQTANDGTVVDDTGETGDVPDGEGDVPVDETPTATPTSTPEQAAVTSLRPGSSGDAVEKLQKRLIALDFFDDDDATGYYGSVTSGAVKLFQRTNGLSIDGIAGESTLKLLYSSSAKRYTIKQGDSGTDVASLQRRLKELKYFSGSATGYYGASTTTAVKAFQKRNSLTQDGKAGSKTRDLIFSSKAKAAATSTSSTTKKNNSTPSSTTTKAPGKGVSGFLEFAKAQLGKKYVSGNEGPNSFDCSGYVYYCLKNSGVSAGRLSAKGFSGVDEWDSVKKSDLKAGDLLFFGLRGSASVGHTGIYIGGNQMIHCSSSKGKVVITDIRSSYWVDNYRSAKRVF